MEMELGFAFEALQRRYYGDLLDWAEFWRTWQALFQLNGHSDVLELGIQAATEAPELVPDNAVELIFSRVDELSISTRLK